MTGLLDAHVHLWDPSLRRYSWLDDAPALRRAYRPAELDGGAGPTGVIVVEAGCDDPSGELDWIETLAADWPVIRAVVAHAPLEHGASVGGLLADFARRPLVAGVRRNVQDETAGFMDDPDFIAGVRALAPHGLTFDACVRAHQLVELTRLVDRCPEVTFVLDHLGKPNIRHHQWEPWWHEIADLAGRPNVFAKLSGLTTEADLDLWRTSDIRPYLDHALAVFGPRRCLFGSDWPVATLATSYQRWVDLIHETIAELPAPDRDEVLAGTATRVYRLDRPRSTPDSSPTTIPRH